MERFPKTNQENKVEKPKIKMGVDFVFEQKPELMQIGTKEKYLEYLNTIFPDSKIKDIVYHGGEGSINEFVNPNDRTNYKANNIGTDSGKNKVGIYFTSDLSMAKQYSKGVNKDNREIYSVILNSNQPKITKVFFALDFKKMINKDFLNPQRITNNDLLNLKKEGYDSVVWMNYEYIVFDDKQIHKLGSEKDMGEFRKFVENQRN